MMSGMERLRHELISASAGSGKTYQLVRRYLHLLTLGAEPETIVAMTFTRKAAGEFFNRILARLAALALGQEDPARYFAGLHPPVPAQVDYHALLAHVTRRMHRLRLGTLDSFFASVVACFPLELGLPSATIMDQDDTVRARDLTIDALLDDLHLRADDATVRLVLEGVKQASFGTAIRSTERLLRTWITDSHEKWADSEGTAVWGNLDRIWPNGDFSGPPPSLEAMQQAHQQLCDHFPATSADGQRFLEELKDELSSFQPGQPLTTRISYFLKITKDHLPDLQRGRAEFKWGRKDTVLTGPATQAWLMILHGLLAREFVVRAHHTRGVASLLAEFERLYHRQVRSTGRLSFADVPRLLAGAAAAGSDAWPPLDLWFRLDGRFDHWMFDEFQDTSFIQWRVVQPLVDEVLQASDGDRSFFAVGDIKQSIYIWREAEPEIFAQTEQTYADPDFGLRVTSLSHSYRSAQPVLDAVNHLFADRTAIETLLPGSTQHWRFETHVAAKDKLPGYAAVIQVPKDPTDSNSFGQEADEAEDGEGSFSAADFNSFHHAAAALIKEIDPIGKGLSCAVLVRQNSKATEMAQALRTLTGLPVVTESEVTPFIDNAVTLALLSLLQLAAHPSDRFASEHLRMTPLRDKIGADPAAIARTASSVAQAVFDRGFTAFVQDWTTTLGEVCPSLDAFHQKRLALLADFAATYDESGDRDIDQFCTSAREHKLRQIGSSQAIQVMTIHKSKGLEFDLVILPELGSTGMNQVKPSAWMIEREQGQTEWVIEQPKTEFIALDPVLAAQREQATQKAGFESLCRLYVAMTRAKQGLYLLAKPPPAKPKSITTERFLRLRLGIEANGPQHPPAEIQGQNLCIEWETGDRDWHQKSAHSAPPPASPPPPSLRPPLGPRLRQLQPRQRRRTPSGEETHSVTGKQLFDRHRDTGRHLGSRVHEMFALIDWWTPGSDLSTLRQAWSAAQLISPEDPLSREALDLVEPVLYSPTCLPAFAQPSAHAWVWNEKSFDCIDEGDWISGIFDRVMLDRDATGKFLSARIIDFKTDRAADETALAEKVAGYAPQLALYRRAVARLTALPPDRVTSALLFVRTQQLVEVH